MVKRNEELNRLFGVNRPAIKQAREVAKQRPESGGFIQGLADLPGNILKGASNVAGGALSAIGNLADAQIQGTVIGPALGIKRKSKQDKLRRAQVFQKKIEIITSGMSSEEQIPQANKLAKDIAIQLGIVTPETAQQLDFTRTFRKAITGDKPKQFTLGPEQDRFTGEGVKIASGRGKPLSPLTQNKTFIDPETGQQGTVSTDAQGNQVFTPIQTATGTLGATQKQLVGTVPGEAITPEGVEDKLDRYVNIRKALLAAQESNPEAFAQENVDIVTDTKGKLRLQVKPREAPAETRREFTDKNINLQQTFTELLDLMQPGRAGAESVGLLDAAVTKGREAVGALTPSQERFAEKFTELQQIIPILNGEKRVSDSDFKRLKRAIPGKILNDPAMRFALRSKQRDVDRSLIFTSKDNTALGLLNPPSLLDAVKVAKKRLNQWEVGDREVRGNRVFIAREIVNGKPRFEEVFE